MGRRIDKQPIELRAASAIGSICDYICLDSDLNALRRCKERCVKFYTDLVKRHRESKAFRDR